MNEEIVKVNFAKNIVALRKSRKLSQQELAEVLNYSNKAISKWETKETLPDIVTFKKIADFFNLTVDELISDKNVVKLSTKQKNRILITLLSAGLTLVLGAIVYLVLQLCLVNMSYLAVIGSVMIASITLIVFTAMWFQKKYLFLAITILIWSSTLLTDTLLNFKHYMFIGLIAFSINVLVGLFLMLSLHSDKEIHD